MLNIIEQIIFVFGKELNSLPQELSTVESSLKYISRKWRKLESSLEPLADTCPF